MRELVYTGLGALCLGGSAIVAIDVNDTLLSTSKTAEQLPHVYEQVKNYLHQDIPIAVSNSLYDFSVQANESAQELTSSLAIYGHGLALTLAILGIYFTAKAFQSKQEPNIEGENK